MWNYFKQNEKVIMVILLAIIAPSFAFTGAMTSAFRGFSGGAWRIYGESYNFAEFHDVRDHVSMLQRAERLSGGAELPAGILYVRNTASPRGTATETQAIHYLMLRHKADQLGLNVGDVELADFVRGRVKSILLSEAIREFQNTPAAERSSNENALKAKLDAVRFTQEGYERLLEELGIRAPEFEDLARENLVIAKLVDLVAGGAIVPESEVFADYQIQNQRRLLEWIRVPVDRFEEEAKKGVGEDDLRRVYDENPSQYKREAEVQIQAFKVKREARSAAKAITDEAIQARYERDKELYRKRKPKPNPTDEKKPEAAPAESTEPSDSPPSEPAEDEFESVDEVRDKIRKSIVEEEEAELLRKVLSAAAALPKPGGDTPAPDIDLAATLGEDAQFVESVKTGLFGRSTIKDVAESLKNNAELLKLLASLDRGHIGEGDFHNQVVKVDDGSYLARVLAYRKAAVPSLDECRDAVAKDAARNKAKELGRAFLAEARGKIMAKEVTLEDFAKAKNYEIRVSPPLARRESSKFKEGDEPVEGGRQLLAAGFELDEPGDLSEPVIDGDPGAVFLVRLNEIQSGDTADWDAQKERIRDERERAKRGVLVREFLQRLASEAQVAYIGEVAEPEDGGRGR